MYNQDVLNQLIKSIQLNHGIHDKVSLASLIQRQFSLVRDRSVYFCKWFAIRFCKSNSLHFGNTVLSLSAERKYDDRPFIVCLVSPAYNDLMLANTTFLRKISHSSQQLTLENIKGSFNGTDILRSFSGLDNVPENFEELFHMHEAIAPEENLQRIVAATHQIQPTGIRFCPSREQSRCIMASIDRTLQFLASREFQTLNADLSASVQAVKPEILLASQIDNVNLRGRVIEFLITEPGGAPKDALIQALHTGAPLPGIFTADGLGDYKRSFDGWHTAMDIKTKLLSRSGNPNGYNIDKFLSFLAEEKSVYLIYLVAVSPGQQVLTRLFSVFCTRLLEGTSVIPHWAGRNSRGVAQFDGRALEAILKEPDPQIDAVRAQAYLEKLIQNDEARRLP